MTPNRAITDFANILIHLFTFARPAEHGEYHMHIREKESERANATKACLFYSTPMAPWCRMLNLSDSDRFSLDGDLPQTTTATSYSFASSSSASSSSSSSSGGGGGGKRGEEHRKCRDGGCHREDNVGVGRGGGGGGGGGRRSLAVLVQVPRSARIAMESARLREATGAVGGFSDWRGAVARPDGRGGSNGNDEPRQ